MSPLRLLSPVLILASVMTAITFYINAVALPAANQAHREIVFSLVVSKARTDVKPRTFSDKVLPDRMMLYVQDIEPEHRALEEPADQRHARPGGDQADPGAQR